MKQWVQSEISKKNNSNKLQSFKKTEIINEKSDSNSSDNESRPTIKKRAFESNQVPAYKCVFNLNEKNYTSSSVNDLKIQFELKRQENNVKY